MNNTHKKYDRIDMVAFAAFTKSSKSPGDIIRAFNKWDKEREAREEIIVNDIPREKCPKCREWCKGRSCNDCQQYW